MHDIQIWFLILSLLFPRIALLLAWCNNQIPPNTIPFWGDFFMALLLPRLLILIYIGTNLGMTSVWFVVHVIAILTIIVGRLAYSRS